MFRNSVNITSEMRVHLHISFGLGPLIPIDPSINIISVSAFNAFSTSSIGFLDALTIRVS